MSPLALYHVPVVDAVADIDGAGYAGAPGLAAGAHCRGQGERCYCFEYLHLVSPVM